ncbi:MAG: hypothetical protein ACRCV9_09550 [Burkholderiaceae bacterium]
MSDQQQNHALAAHLAKNAAELRALAESLLEASAAVAELRPAALTEEESLELITQAYALLRVDIAGIYFRIRDRVLLPEHRLALHQLRAAAGSSTNNYMREKSTLDFLCMLAKAAAHSRPQNIHTIQTAA